MRSAFLRRRVSPLVALAALALSPSLAPAAAPANLPLRDDFDSKLTLDWGTIRPDPTHVSLESHPGKLTITTQYGSMHGSQTSAKNLMLIAVPEGLEDFVVTTCIENFLPETTWQQAGLLFYDDDDHYLKWVRDYTVQGYPVLNAYWEFEGEMKGVPVPVEVSKERFWLRVVKRGNDYQCLASLDGAAFTTYAIVPWGERAPAKVGLVAKNGPREGDMDARFDFFELRKPNGEEQRDPVFAARRALAGTWRAVERHVDGQLATRGPATTLTVDRGTLIVQEGPKMMFSFTLDPATAPSRITLIPRQHGLAQLLHGIYSLEGDTLTLCLNPLVNGKPPESLEARQGDGYLLLKMVREPKPQ